MTNYKKYDKIKKGDIFIVDLPKNNDHIQGGIRPCMVVSNNQANSSSPNVTIIPLTSQQKKLIPTHILLNAGCAGLEKDSTITAEQLITIPKYKLGNYVGRLSDAEMAVVNAALLIQLDIPANSEYMSQLTYIMADLMKGKNIAAQAV